MIATVVHDGDQHAAFFRLGTYASGGLIMAHSVRLPPAKGLSPRFTPQVFIQLALHEPPESGENNQNSPAIEANVRLTAIDLQRVIAGLAALERQLRGAV